ncbi:hypothetical protein AURDEDRAFT_174461 [Auricularia subglabra TFB-10046 SS5]|uniref:Uncharacterized protein n=1 Tax=Auricularia subglabra (strain TFB-10046 / SS5) TaxID=717982 RepID=J0WT85_AURST|nr:hypothetical protein AURDEDRAFT_174461 [Auricularia subglabra TFB-10046 SS5]
MFILRVVLAAFVVATVSAKPVPFGPGDDAGDIHTDGCIPFKRDLPELEQRACCRLLKREDTKLERSLMLSTGQH